MAPVFNTTSISFVSGKPSQLPMTPRGSADVALGASELDVLVILLVVLTTAGSLFSFSF